jgi:hypothetical protein
MGQGVNCGVCGILVLCFESIDQEGKELCHECYSALHAWLNRCSWPDCDHGPSHYSSEGFA